jgi:hypothetical protein
MNFYFIEEAIRTEETGTQYPQILKMSKQQDYDDDNGVYVFSRNPLPDKSPDLKYLILDNEAKLTDVLSAVMLRLNGFLVNDRFKDVIRNYKLPQHRYYEAYVLSQLIEYKYYWLQMVVNYDMRCINFTKSNFIITTTSIIKNPPIPVEIHSYEDYKEKQSKLNSKQIIKVSKAILNDSFGKDTLDIFKIPELSMSWIISERLKDELVKKKITGIRIVEAGSVSV